jgi:hypothetical protein
MPPAQTQQQNNRRIEAEFVTLRDYVDTRLDAIEKEKDASTRALEKRLDGMNEIRDALKDQQSFFVSKAEYRTAHERLADDIRSLRESRALLEGKASTESVNKVGNTALTGIAIGVIGMIISVISLLLRLMGL